jgi:hypothetical protein
MRKGKFHEQRISKLMYRGDGHFQIIKMINDNAYKVDLPGKNVVNATFNIYNLSLFDVGDDLKIYPFK